MKHYKPFVFLPIVCSGPLSFASACSLALARTTSCSRPWAGRKALDSTPQRPALARPALLQLRFIRQQAFPASTSSVSLRHARHARFAAGRAPCQDCRHVCCPRSALQGCKVRYQCQTVSPHGAEPPVHLIYTTIGALSVLSRYWNKVTEPYRFSVRQTVSLL